MAGVYHCLCMAERTTQLKRYPNRSEFEQEIHIVTANQFRRIALSFPETEEGAHMDHPDFRVAGRIFATLGYPDNHWAMVKLPPEQQHYFSKAAPDVFMPSKGAWGRQGSTSVQLKGADQKILRKAMLAAWRHRAPKKLIQQFQVEIES